MKQTGHRPRWKQVMSIVLLAMVWGQLCHQSARCDETPGHGRLFYLGVTCDNDPGKGQTIADFDYAADNFTRLLTTLARPHFQEIHVSTVKGHEASTQAVMQKLHELRQDIRPHDLLFLYWGTHGSTQPEGWVGCLGGGQELHGRQLKTELGQFRCPVIAVISTCGSAGFARPTPKDNIPLPENVTAFCACRKKQSTDNQLDVALCEALSGFADFDGNGHITLHETLEYVPLRYREWYPPQSREVESHLPVLAHSKSAPLQRSLCKVDENLAAAVHGGEWYGASIVDRRSDAVKVRFLGWDSTGKRGHYAFPDEFVKDEVIDLPGGQPPVSVEWKGTWYPARILSRNGDQIRIHYIGYSASDDETVALDRVRHLFVTRKHTSSKGEPGP